MVLKMRAWLSRFSRAREGVAAVEFALIAPMAVMLLLGSIEIINLLQADRRLENTASSVADVLSRDNSIDNDEMTGTLTATGPLMFPNDGDDVDLRITAIIIDDDDSASVVWSDIRGTTYPQLSAGTAVDGLPATMMRPGTSLIRVEAAFAYRPRLGFFLVDNNRNLSSDNAQRNLRHTAFRRSRLVDPIPRDRT